MRISDWSSDVCSSDLFAPLEAATLDVGEDRVKTGDNFLDIAAIEHANLAEHARVRLAAGNVLAIQARVKAHRLGEFLDEGRGGFGEAADRKSTRLNSSH